MNLQTLRSLGVVVSLSQSGKLRFEAKPGVMTSEVKSRIADHKESLIYELQSPPGSVNLVNLVNFKSDCVTWSDNLAAQTTDVHVALQHNQSENAKSPHLLENKLNTWRPCPSSPPSSLLTDKSNSNSPGGADESGHFGLSIGALLELGITASISPAGKLHLECEVGVLTDELKSQIEVSRDFLIAEIQTRAKLVNLTNPQSEGLPFIDHQAAPDTLNQCSPSSPSSQDAGQGMPFISRSWHKTADSYHAHHFACRICQAAGRGSRYGERCGVGKELWATYMLDYESQSELNSPRTIQS